MAHRCQPYEPAALYSLETLLFFCFWYSFRIEAEKKKAFRKPDMFLSSGEGREIHILLGILGRANLKHW
jgi:hypothetical protein